MAYEQPLAEGYHYLQLKCQGCGIRKRLVVPAYPLPLGSLLDAQWGPDAHCIKCGAARLEVMNEPAKPPPPPPPPGFVKKPT